MTKPGARKLVHARRGEEKSDEGVKKHHFAPRLLQTVKNASEPMHCFKWKIFCR